MGRVFWGITAWTIVSDKVLNHLIMSESSEKGLNRVIISESCDNV